MFPRYMKEIVKLLRTRIRMAGGVGILNDQLDDNLSLFSPVFSLTLDSLILSLTPGVKTKYVKHLFNSHPYVALGNNLIDSCLCKEFLVSCLRLVLSFPLHQTGSIAGRNRFTVPLLGNTISLKYAKPRGNGQPHSQRLSFYEQEG